MSQSREPNAIYKVRDALAKLRGYPMRVRTISLEGAGNAPAGFRDDAYFFLETRVAISETGI